MRAIPSGRAIIEQLILEGLTTAASVDEHVFQLREPPQVDLQLRITPTRVFTHRAAAKTALRAADVLRTALPIYHLNQQFQQPPGLRGQLIECSPQHFVRELIGKRD